ncbi:class I SAM-dependent methyltransferase [Halovenus rubra]
MGDTVVHVDEVSQTRNIYESEAGSYIEKYSTESVARLYGDPFFDALESACSGDTAQLLDIGCGPGPDVDVFAAAGHDVTGLDITQSFLREGTKRVSGAEFVCGDMRSLPFQDNSFDGIWASASFHHIPRSAATQTLRDWHRVLRPAGTLFIAVKRDEQLDDDSTNRHFEYYQADAFRTLLNSVGFELNTARTKDKWVSAVATA